MKRTIQKVIILGSGESILDLSEQEVAYINKCEIVIAVNKFAAFYEKAKIIPTHIYFHDLFGVNILLYIVKLLKKNRIADITIFTNSFIKNILVCKNENLISKILIDFIYHRLRALIIIILKFGKNSNIHKYKLFRKVKYYKLPNTYQVNSIKLTKWNSDSESWGKNLNEKIYHFRGSLTSVFNLVSIIAPNYEIALVGNDFNGDKYFYEEELDNTGIPWRDFTYEKVKKKKIHFSFHKINGKTMSDKIPYILKMLENSGNKVFCNNPNSLLVTKCNIKFKKLIS